MLPTKFSQGKVKESACTNTATNVFDSLNTTSTKTRQANKLLCCPQKS